MTPAWSTGSWGTGSGSWTTTTTSPYSTPDIQVAGNVVCEDIQIANASLATMLQNVSFLIPPTGLKLDNVAVVDLHAEWLNTLDQLRRAHLALAAVVALTQTND